MSKAGRPTNHRVPKLFSIDPELEIRANARLIPEGLSKPPHGAWSDLLNNLIRQWLERKDNV